MSQWLFAQAQQTWKKKSEIASNEHLVNLHKNVNQISNKNKINIKGKVSVFQLITAMFRVKTLGQ